MNKTTPQLLAAAELVENMEPYDCDYVESLPTGWYEAALLLARHVKAGMDETLVDGVWLESLGWRPIGNTWYPPESSMPKNYSEPYPLLFWVRVDGAVYIARSGWKSCNDVTRGQLLLLLAALGVEVTP